VVGVSPRGSDRELGVKSGLLGFGRPLAPTVRGPYRLPPFRLSGIIKGMKIVHYTEVPAENPGGETKDVTIRWVISGPDGAPNFYMRVFEIAPGGYSPLHRHPWEHEIYFLSGDGEVVQEAGSLAVRPGTAVFIPGEETHQIVNPGEQLLRFICIIPSSGA